MMKQIRSKFILLFVIALFSVAIQAKVVPLPLEDLIKKSNLIVVGEVLSVDYVKGVYFAKVKVQQTLKGDSTRIVYFSTERLWACDISRGYKGDSGLFLFEKYQIKPTIFRNTEETNLFKEAVAKFTNNSDLFRLSFDGRGRMTLIEKGDKELLEISQEIILPKGIKSEMSEIIQYTNKVLSNN